MAAFSQQVRMKELLNEQRLYTGRNFYKTKFHLPLALNCAQVVFFEQGICWALIIKELPRKL